MGGKVWAQGETLKRFSIAVSAAASDSEKEAAVELRDYWKTAFGVEPELTDAPPAGPAIWVGFEGAPREALEGIDSPAFAPQELLIRTFDKDGQPQLLIAGGPEDGTLYGVYQFIEDYLGVRWLAPGVTHIPQAPTSIPAIDFHYCPVFDYRYSDFLCQIEDQEALEEYMRVHRWRRGPMFACHTAYRYVPPQDHFKEHPEWYSMVRGKRLAPDFDWRTRRESLNQHTEVGQLCMTNTEMLDFVKQQIDAEIAGNPEKTIHHLSQMDWHNWCECEKCAAIDEREGTQMGSALWGLNYIAEWLEKEHPGHILETLAYQYTRKPPKHVKPRPNVAIKLCSIECDMSRPFNDPESGNQTFAEDVRKWAEIAPRMHCWDYLTNFGCAQTPLPNFQVMQPNVQFLAANSGKAYFPEGWFDYAAEFSTLKTYLLSKLMWNPDVDFEAAMDEFLRLYYKDAAPHIRAYIGLLAETQQASGMPMGCFDDGAWYTPEAVEKARPIMAKAFDAAKSPEIRERVEQVNVTVEWAALKCAPSVDVCNETMSVTRPDSLTIDEYEAMLVRLGGKRNTVFSREVSGFRQLIGNATPPRRLKSPVLAIENERCLVWVAPKLAGTIVRFYDKKLDAELLAEPQVYGSRGGFWQDWTDTPGSYEHVIAPEYEVVEQTEERMVLEALLDSGLRVRRTMELAPGSATFDVALTLTNTTAEPLKPNAKIHPEFFLPVGQSVALHGLIDGVWQPLNAGNEGRSRTMYFDPEYAKLTYLLPKIDRTVYVEVGDGVGGLLCYYAANPEKQHMNLDLRPPQRDLAPGETVTFGGKYGAVQGPMHSATR